MKKSISLICFLAIALSVFSQNYFTRSGHIHMVSKTGIFDLETDNYQVFSTLNTKTGQVTFAALIKSFEFDVAMADRYLDNNHIEMKEFPKVELKGRIDDISSVNFNKPGKYNVTISGLFAANGQERRAKAIGTIVVSSKGITAESHYTLRLPESSVAEINKVLRNKLPSMLQIDAKTIGISRNIEIDVNMVFQAR